MKLQQNLISILKRKRKTKHEFSFSEKVEKNDFEEEEYEYVSGSDLDKSVISSSSELNEEQIFGKNHLSEINEDINKYINSKQN